METLIERYAVPQGKTLTSADRERIERISDEIWHLVFHHLDDEAMPLCATASAADVAEAAAASYRRLAGRFWAQYA